MAAYTNWPRLSSVITPATLDEFADDVAAGRRVLVGRFREGQPLARIPPSEIADAWDRYRVPEKVFDLKKNTVLAVVPSRLRADKSLWIAVAYRDVRVRPIAASAKNPGGRPRKIDDEFWIEVAFEAALNDLKPEHRAEFTSKIMEFCERRWGDDAPSPSTVEKKLSALYKRARR